MSHFLDSRTAAATYCALVVLVIDKYCRGCVCVHPIQTITATGGLTSQKVVQQFRRHLSRGRQIGNWAWLAGWKWSGRPTEIFSGTLYDGFTLIFVVTGGLLSVWTFSRKYLNSKHPKRVMQNPDDTLEFCLKQCMSFSHIIFTTFPFINIFRVESKKCGQMAIEREPLDECVLPKRLGSEQTNLWADSLTLNHVYFDTAIKECRKAAVAIFSSC